MVVNNVTRFLDSRKIPYTIFELPPEIKGAEVVAQHLDVPPEIVFKSIVIVRKLKGKPILAVIPGNRAVNLKALAKAIGEKKVSPATQREAEQMTKLKVGGISPLALINRGFEIIIHSSVQDSAEIHISGGERGLNIRLSTQDLVQLTGAKIADIC